MDLFKKHLFSEFWITYTHFHYIIISLFFGPGLNEWALCLQAAAKILHYFSFYPRLKLMLCWIFHVCKGIRRQSQHLSRGVANLGAIGSLWHHKRLLFQRCVLYLEWRMDTARFLAEFAERHLVKGFFKIFFVKTQDSMISVLRALQLSQDFH